MAGYRDRLPQLGREPFLTDGGIETTLIFHEGLDLPLFAAFHLLRDETGRAALRRYYEPYLALAREQGRGLILESPTWRASADWGRQLGYDAAALDLVNREAVALMGELRERHAGRWPLVISGCVGPRGDAYGPEQLMSPDEAESYHKAQVQTFARTEADMVTAITMTHSGEAIGIVRAATAAGLPVAISFTLETDGRLPSGEALGEAIRTVDRATDAGSAYFMINCAHPSHFAGVLDTDESWVQRIRGLRANASKRSHAELDAAEELDEGDPAELSQDYAALRRRLPWLTVLGGCCGTDHRHIEAISQACS